MSVAPAIASLATGAYTVTRQASGSYDEGGIYTAGATSTFSINAVVHPIDSGGTQGASGLELLQLAASQTTKEIRVVITTTELKTRTAGTEPDKIDIGGIDFEVIAVERWEAPGDLYFRAYASRVET